ncbi:glycosyltransferase family 4 protein [Methylobacterium oryzihabitans]|uniref:Glycosyltransferase n=1 Tax=Methylobacterium oryzihabitans TaxID=2499852 RepID=A0A3S2VDT6_9HYPH|nr:glycosyltransferase family 4 protein [Methylobacterium oryzihabitans]RVU20539.1 glycosyltransferase [Methylobacterium oryzihabitans]
MRMSLTGGDAPHVLMTADAVGGVWQYSLDLARGLGAEGFRVTLAVLGPAPSPAQVAAAGAAEAEAGPGPRLVTTGLPLDWTADTPEAVIEAGRALGRLGRALGADLVHLHGPAYAAAGGFGVPVVAVCHSCVGTWWDAVIGGKLPADLAWRHDLATQGCRAADALLAPTRAFAEAVRRVHGLPAAPVAVHNGRRPHRIARDAAPAAGAVTAGRLWDRAKNAAGLDRIAGRIATPILAAGPTEGPTGERIALTHLRALGQLDGAAMAGILSGRPLFVSLALYEPFGLAVLEAAQAGCPLVLSDLPGFRELWDGTALFVDADDEAGAGAAIEALAADPEQRRALGDAARRRAARYGVAAMIAGVRDLHRRLLGIGASAEAAA